MKLRRHESEADRALKDAANRLRIVESRNNAVDEVVEALIAWRLQNSVQPDTEGPISI
jgi:hypothetical protein